MRTDKQLYGTFIHIVLEYYLETNKNFNSKEEMRNYIITHYVPFDDIKKIPDKYFNYVIDLIWKLITVTKIPKKLKEFHKEKISNGYIVLTEQPIYKKIKSDEIINQYHKSLRPDALYINNYNKKIYILEIKSGSDNNKIKHKIQMLKYKNMIKRLYTTYKIHCCLYYYKYDRIDVLFANHL
jgi:hypothetical protein